MNKRCLMVTSEPFYYEEYVELLERLGVEVVLAMTVAEVPDILAKEEINFALINNTMFGRIPDVNWEVDSFNVGVDYTSVYLEEKGIPYMILCTARKPSENIKLKNMFYCDFESNLLPDELKSILEKQKLI